MFRAMVAVAAFLYATVPASALPKDERELLANLVFAGLMDTMRQPEGVTQTCADLKALIVKTFATSTPPRNTRSALILLKKIRIEGVIFRVQP
ncbi:MAG: hypothetical protein SGJ03_16625 [Alphaproteobacteria bacterium]|nr:hypothetical protein [Alphaproteobacteria bacterium]